MKHKLSDIEDGFHYSDFDGGDTNIAYLDRETGHVYFYTEFGDSFEELPEDIEDNDRYVAIPDKRELDLGSRLVFRFISEQADHLYGDVRDIFSRKGAYRRYKSLLETNNLLDAWHNYENQQTDAALREWCAENEIELAEDGPNHPAPG